MSGLVLSILPFALGAAVSPTLFTVEFMILAGKVKAKARTWLFVLGAMATLLAFVLLCLSVLRNVAASGTTPPSPWSIGLKLVLALVLLYLGFRQLHHRKTASEQHASKVRQRLQTAKLPFFLGVGIVTMALNASTLVLYIPAMHIVVHSDAGTTAQVTAVVVMYLITVVPFVLPVLAVSIVGHRSDALLARLNTWTTSHSRQINAFIAFLFAAILAYSGIKEWLG